MIKSFSKIALLPIVFFALPLPAHAHMDSGISSGLTHPLFGVDHLLAMVAVGVLSVLIGGKAVWQVPAAFLIFMVVGGVFGMTGMGLPFAESGIALSVLILGGAIAVSRKIALTPVILSVAVFAVFHGQAHGAEMPTMANPALYGLGFLTATALLHSAGVLIGYNAKKAALSLRLLKYSGLAISLFGIYFLINI